MIRRRSSIACAPLLLALLLPLVLTGCDTHEAKEAARHAELVAAGQEDAAAGLFHADVLMQRSYDLGDSWRSDRDHEFLIKDQSHLRARVALRNVRPERTYSLHLVWIGPDGRELFRRYAEVTRHRVALPVGVAPDDAGELPPAYRAELTRRFGEKRGAQVAEALAATPGDTVPVNVRLYRDAVDLGDVSRLVRVRDPDDRAELRAYSQMNISREKRREPGEYRLQIYLDRKLLREVPFTIVDPS